MPDLGDISSNLAWPLAILLAWLAGEIGHRYATLPRISIYGLTGFALASSQIGLLPPYTDAPVLLLANIAFGLILFEFGYRINLRWLRVNPWIALSGIVEAVASFAAVYYLSLYYKLSSDTAALLAALAMATSPAAVLRVINEQRSSGQVTERALHLAAINSVLAVFAFKMIVGYLAYQSSGDLWRAAYASLFTLAMSALLGAFSGTLMPALLRSMAQPADGTVAYAVAVIGLVALTHQLKLSPVLATLTFGCVARHQRSMLSTTQRNFGPLGDLLTVLLFVFVASSLEWKQIQDGVQLGVILAVARSLTKLAGVGLFAHIGGISWRKGLWLGLALTPISAFLILVLEQTPFLNVDLMERVAPLAAATLLLEILGPALTQLALIWADEVPKD